MTLRAFGPRPADAPERECYACKQLFRAGDYTTLVPLGPGDDAEARERCAEGRPYNAVGIEVHYACATGEEPTP